MGELVQNSAATRECLCHHDLFEGFGCLLVEDGESVHISIAAEQTCGEIGELPEDTTEVEI